MTTYQGHASRNAWNVALWIGNDEGLYRYALECIRRTPNKEAAARLMLAGLADMGVTKTPDGAPYTITSVRQALIGLEG